LATGPFFVTNGDVWCDLDYRQLRIGDQDLAQIVLVDNPPHHPDGDFGLLGDRVQQHGGERLTFSGIGIYRPQLFADCQPGAFPLAPLLRAAIADRRCGGLHHRGQWLDIGTPERLQALDRMLRNL
jgi:MurNAc alpha-1-phosphate uridylyltransferase